MNPKDLLVELENVSKIFNQKVWAIKKINLKIYRGEGIAVIGPNQSGKTVLGRLIANQIKQTGGIIEYNFNRGDAFSSIGFQFRQTTWPEGFKVKEVVELYKNIYDIQDEGWLDELSNVFQVAPRLDKTLNSCNRSWLQLFALYLAFLHKPELIVLDEVSNTIGLDMKTKVINFLKKYKEEHNATFVIMSPDNSLFEALCSRIIVMESGLVLSDDYVDQWSEGENFEIYTTKLMNAIEEQQTQLKPDPVFKPILRKFENKLSKFNEVYDKFINNEQVSALIEEDSIVIKIKNINFHVQELLSRMNILASSALSKTNIDNVKIENKLLLKLIKKLVRLNKKNHKSEEYTLKKPVNQFLKGIESFTKYLRVDIHDTFKNNKVIVYGNEITAELSKKEMTQLRFLKKKYIQEEIRIMKLEARILKRQERIRQIDEKNKVID
ncbi:ATP-binding cassette domain-containing protein [Spiroplasma culicicola]|uniref:ABC transporter ATP-binding protein n=1 Tax=Spiroplasma culicicola AES-1 TaxID=1276246 RepID=W6AHE5_9MOLU|nr:ATP-binding cassette domain-containing protein [Spiroplasma culicicola]AHI53114.1 ABC transporter ATP-binding protein [Spiroplasma culicicola AES-1]